MKTIWKARIKKHAKFDVMWEINIPAPLGSRAISVGIQDDEPTVWFEVDTDKPEGRLRLYAVGTGRSVFPNNARFVGTFIQNENVFHIYAEN